MKTLTLTILFFAIAATSFATQDKKTLNLRIQGVDGYLDETAVYFDLGVSPAYFYAQDAAKVFSTIAAMPAIYTITSDNVNCSNTGYSDLSETAVIGLGVVVPTSGTFKITMRSLNNFNPTTIITLEDRLLNVFTDLRTNFYSVQINTEVAASGRFFLHVVKAVQFNTITAGCTNIDGTVSVIADSSIQWDLCQLFDSNGTAAGNYSNISGPFNFSALSAGDYSIRFTYGTYTATQQIHLDGNYVKASIGSAINTVLVGEEITFSSTTTNATGFQWNFGTDYIIKTFSTGERCIENLSLKPDIIILDYYLNGIDKKASDGLETLDKIKAIDPHIPVIMLSSQDKIEVAVSCMQHLATDYVVKSETAFVRLRKIITLVFLSQKMEKELNWYMERL